MGIITGNTQIFGILADPIHHVKTPQRINQLFTERQIDGVMVPMHVKTGELAQAVQGLRAVRNLSGFVVTVPHKTAVVALCDELTPEALRTEAVNVVHCTTDGRLIGGMLDGEGFIVGLRSRGLDPVGRSVYLAGAGGAASAIAFAMARAGVSRLTIANRTADKAQQLVDRIAHHYPLLSLAVGSSDPIGHDLVVNATSLGLRPRDALPLDADRLEPEQIVAEIIMQPEETPLLLTAKSKGCRIHYGAPMLASQIELMATFMTTGKHHEYV